MARKEGGGDDDDDDDEDDGEDGEDGEDREDGEDGEEECDEEEVPAGPHIENKRPFVPAAGASAVSLMPTAVKPVGERNTQAREYPAFGERRASATSSPEPGVKSLKMLP